MKRYFFLLVSILFLTGIHASTQGQIPILTDSIFTKYNEVNLTSPNLWRFIPGHDIDTLESNFLKENWEPVNITLPKNETPKEWNGTGWFCTIIKIDSTLFGKEMAIRGHIRGAMEFYVNGVLLDTIGTVGENKDTEVAAGFFEPIRFTFNNEPDQLLAIKYSNHTAQSFFNKEISGLQLYIGYPKKIHTTNEFVINRVQKQTNQFYLIFGFIVALGFLHLFLYIFYPSDRANLTCSLFFFFISGIFLSGIIFNSMDSPSQYISYTFAEGLAITLTSIILPFFIYQLINRKFDWIPILILATGVLVLIFHFINPVAYQVFYYLFFLTSITIGIVILMYTRFIKKIKALNIILLFYLIAFILLFPSLLQISFGLEILWYNNTMLMNMSAIPVSVGYSFYLARGVAITNKQLKEKLEENEFLSSAKLKIESEKKQLIENQKNNLEKEVKERTADLQKSLHELKATQAQLIQSEKMASLGELTAGIAHEIQNPLNFVNNFSEVSNEMIDEMKVEQAAGNWSLATEIADDVKSNLEKILHHGKRADGIVKGMLQHSKSSSGKKEATDINALCDEYLRLAYHGLRAKDKCFNAKFETDFDTSLEKINVVPQDIGRVILNLITNAFYAVNLKTQDLASPQYTPTVIVTTKKEGNSVLISVKDNGSGIPDSIKEKIFQPFFTTKPTGQGTGLGLSLSYDIVKAHSGDIKVETKESDGSMFIISLPII